MIGNSMSTSESTLLPVPFGTRATVYLLLLISSAIMAMAWLGHLVFEDELNFWQAMLMSWFIVLPEYALNILALRMRAPESPSLARYREVAQIVTGRPEAELPDGINWVQNICQRLKLPPLADYKITEAAFPLLVEKAQAASSMKGNPIQLTEEELLKILREAL